MSIHLSLYWESADQLQWYWGGDETTHTGTLETLIEQKIERNLDIVNTRLFLPETWFSLINIQVPANSKRISSEAIKFATEEYLAEDIESVHFVLNGRPIRGNATVVVTQLHRFEMVLQTLTLRHFSVTQSYSPELIEVNDKQTHEVLIRVSENSITFSSNGQLFKVHPKGFSQWFALWAEQNSLSQDATVLIVSDQAEGDALNIRTELEVSGLQVEMQIQAEQSLLAWHEAVDEKRPQCNLITQQFNQSNSKANVGLWAPITVAVAFCLIIWVALTLLNNAQIKRQIDQTWLASENVFLQVFGKAKRIQRPLMIRELRNVVASSGASDASTEFNALVVLSELTDIPASVLMEDFRFNRDRNEAYFTLIQDVNAQGDAYGTFESLKTELMNTGYQVEYSANQDREDYRARFKVVYGSAS